jgi:rhamnosyltransferase
MTKNNSSVLVLLASYNGQDYLMDQVHSILNQKGVEVKIVISDDGSTDSTPEIIKNLCETNANVSCINFNRIGGPAKNFYHLIKFAASENKHKFIALSDQDDIWPEYKLARALKKIMEENLEGYSSDVLAFNNDLTSSFKLIKKSHPQTKFDYLFETPGPGCSFVMTNNLISLLCKKLKGKSSCFPYHDWLIYAFARHNNLKWGIDDSPNLLYRQHNNNFMGANNGLTAMLKRLNRILFGEYYKELIFLYGILNPELKNLNFIKVWAFIFRFHQTRRKISHALLMIPFLLIVSIQKNEI